MIELNGRRNIGQHAGTNKLKEAMKSIMTLSVITGLAALALVGCNQNTPDSSTNVPSTNTPAAGNAPDLNTNLPTTNSVPDQNTNMAASTNQ